MTAPPPAPPPGGALRALLVVIAILAIAVPAWVVTHPPAIHRPPAVLAGLRHHVVPPAELPPVEPVRFVQLAPEDARAFNATVPFVDGPNPPARAFRFTGTPDDLARATDCLAAAVIYEAGDDTTGERAVAQVILNRLRHPAFPKTVCGVVFEGSERSTGCQFTFTCDGALTRWTPTAAGWRRAREVATAALAGSVDKPVGLATHYHTDWVVPYWQASLDKIAQVGTHLFFRWSGWWGTPPAFSRRPTIGEPVELKLAMISSTHSLGAGLAQLALTGDAVTASSDGPPMALSAEFLPQPAPGYPNSFYTSLNPRWRPDDFPALALRACAARPQCIFMGWTDPSRMASTRPLTPDQMAAMSFSYFRDRPDGLERTLWNCDEFKRTDPHQCMKRALQSAASVPPQASPTTPAFSTMRSADPLAEVRRRATDPEATPGTPNQGSGATPPAAGTSPVPSRP